MLAESTLEKTLKLTLKILALLLTLPTLAIAGNIGGMVYLDADESAQSLLHQGYNYGDRVLPYVQIELSNGTTTQVKRTSQYGTYAFLNQPDGIYFVRPLLPDWLKDTSKNLPERVPEAIAEGEMTILTIGDSLGVIGSNKPYPNWLAEHFGALCDVTLHNLHVSGSRSWEWMPGDPKAYYENRVLPYAADVDLIVVTVGGNDADIYIEDMGWDDYDIVTIVQNFFNDPSYVTEIFPRVRQLLDDLHAAAPQADIVYMIYPNYVNSDWVTPPLGFFANFFHDLLGGIIEDQRRDFKDFDYLTIADQYTYWYLTELDPYLFDAIHFNDLGAEELARVMFNALGGVILDADHPKDLHSYGLKLNLP
jgi:lysophospholipase L1-like esterase